LAGILGTRGDLGAGQWAQDYYTQHPLTVQENEETWGKPIAVEKHKDGLEIRFYRLGNTQDLGGYRYFTSRGGRIIDGGISPHVAGVTTATAQPAGRGKTGAPSEAVEAAATREEQVWGRPVAVRKLGDGVEERYYRYQNTMDLEYRYFRVKDGRVIASGLTGAIRDPGESRQEKGLPLNDLSKAYYEHRPLSLAEEEQLWGKPAAVKKLSNGMEERYYRYQNTLDLGYRYFVIQDGRVVASGIAR